jgi:hypothetical protein
MGIPIVPHDSKSMEQVQRMMVGIWLKSPSSSMMLTIDINISSSRTKFRKQVLAATPADTGNAMYDALYL